MRHFPRLPRLRPVQRIAAACLVAAAALAAGTASAGAAEAWRWPTGPPVVVLRGFEPPPGPYAPGHRGVDLAAREGAVVRAAGAGTVVFAGAVAGRPVVVLAHGPARTVDELRTTYEPVVAAVPVGRTVSAGEVIGRLGRWPGHCSQSCLHWGLRRGTTYLDPRSLLAGPVRLLPVGPPVGAAAAAADDVSASRAAEPVAGAGAVTDRSGRVPRPPVGGLTVLSALAGLGTWVARHRIATRAAALIPRPRGSPP